MRLPPALLPLVAALAACSAPGPDISAEKAWARATGRSGMAAAYLTINNKGAADELTGVRTSIGEAMLHEASIEDGVMRMRPIEHGQGMVVASNGRLALAPSGAHVMISGLKRPLAAGDRFDLTLLFEKSRPKKVAVEVRPADAAAH